MLWYWKDFSIQVSSFSWKQTNWLIWCWWPIGFNSPISRVVMKIDVSLNKKLSQPAHPDFCCDGPLSTSCFNLWMSSDKIGELLKDFVTLLKINFSIWIKSTFVTYLPWSLHNWVTQLWEFQFLFHNLFDSTYPCDKYSLMFLKMVCHNIFDIVYISCRKLY